MNRNPNVANDNLVNRRWFCLTPAVLAIGLHTILLTSSIYHELGFNLSIYSSASLISWLVSIQIIFASIKRPVEVIAIVMFPLTAAALLVEWTSDSTNILSSTFSSGMQSHIMVSLIAYSLLMLGAIQALALAYQHHAIKKHKPTGLVKKLPPLHDMESLLFQILDFGFLFFTASLISGFLIFDDLFAQHLIHKTVLAIIGWVTLLILLIGRHISGWRGLTAVRWSIVSFCFLVVAYFGSKFVLEVML
ncbi:MAG: cytochrome c biogenesis protein CcsA [Gammaproteobacteria bacterium]|nr:cytochrome c biogenesis protein CcsA [Gammaproteobacteria bacterium]